MTSVGPTPIPFGPTPIPMQVGFVDELKRLYEMEVGQIAEMLSRSKAWVSLRLGLLAEMTPAVWAMLFAGAFPVYAYMLPASRAS